MRNLILITVVASIIPVALPSNLNAESNAIHGSSSSRGVSTFQVPGQASIGSSTISSFRQYSTGLDRSLSESRNSMSSLSRSSYKSMTPSVGSSLRLNTSRSPLQINSKAPGLKLGRPINNRTANKFSVPSLSNQAVSQKRQYQVKSLPKISTYRASRNIFAAGNLNMQDYASSVLSGKTNRSYSSSGISGLKSSLSYSRLHVNRGLAAVNTTISSGKGFRPTGISTPTVNRLLRKR